MLWTHWILRAAAFAKGHARPTHGEARFEGTVTSRRPACAMRENQRLVRRALLVRRTALGQLTAR
jgi:hypothetical protein